MKLRDWLSRKRMEQKEFAQISGFTCQKVSNYCIGRTIPTIQDAYYIQKLTKNRVKIKDWLLVDDLQVETIENEKEERGEEAHTEAECLVCQPQVAYFKG